MKQPKNLPNPKTFCDQVTTSHHVHSTRNGIQNPKDIKMEEEKCLSSYDVKALFTSVSMEPALLKINKEQLE